jgi:hypothetical protein
MAERKPFLGDIKQDAELNTLLEASRAKKVTDDELREQHMAMLPRMRRTSQKTAFGRHRSTSY